MIYRHGFLAIYWMRLVDYSPPSHKVVRKSQYYNHKRTARCHSNPEPTNLLAHHVSSAIRLAINYERYFSKVRRTISRFRKLGQLIGGSTLRSAISAPRSSKLTTPGRRSKSKPNPVRPQGLRFDDTDVERSKEEFAL
jgi:hypothetical protein